MDSTNRDIKQYSKYIGLLMEEAPETFIASTQLAPEYRDYCLSIANQNQDMKKEIYSLLITCGWVSDKLFKYALSVQDNTNNMNALSKEIIIELEAWRKGIMINAEITVLKAAYEAITSWWKQLCYTLEAMVKKSLNDISGHSIAFASDLAIAKWSNNAIRIQNQP